MSDEKEFCVICAWRENCKKKFSLKAGQRCPDFSKDLAIKDKPEEKKEGK
ncbi:MAG: hypothetical protein HQL08_07540 [Nitrospirae bacterium]|nr:hypothetical protein [Nitrospirota bacterium]